MGWNRSLEKDGKAFFVRMLVFVSLAVLFSGTCGQSQPFETHALDSRIWTGEVVINRIGSANREGDASLSNAHVLKTYKESRQTNDYRRIKACGEAGQLYVLKVDVELSESQEIRSTYKEKSRNCSVKKPDLRKPGNSGHRSVMFRISRYEGEDCPPLEKISTVRLMVWPGGRYVLNVTVGAYADRQQDEMDYTKWVCDGHTTQAEFHLRTIGIKEKPRSRMHDEGDGDNVHTILQSFQPPLMAPAGFTFEGNVGKDGSIADTLPISEIKAKTKGGYQEKTTASWSFTASDPCEIVYDLMIQDLALAQAYADTKRQDFYDHWEDYDKAVEQWAGKIYSAELAASGNSSTGGDNEADMTTSCDCVIDEKGFKEKVKKGCQPYIIYKSVLRHEKQHALQCTAQGSRIFCSKSPHIRGPNEADAYIAGAKVYHYWLKKNCPNYDAATVKNRIKAVQSK